MSLKIMYINIIFILSLFGSIFTAIKIADFSLSAFITFSALIIPLFFLGFNIQKNVLKIALPFILYCIYDFASFFWGPITKSVLQDFTVWGGMLMLFIISTTPFSNIQNNIIKIMDIAKYPFLLLLTYFLLTKIDSPATMILTTLFFSYFLAKFLTIRISKFEVIILIYLFLVPIITGSRIIYITEILVLFIFVLSFYGNKHSIKNNLKKLLFIVFSIFVIISVAFIFQNRINDAMLKGDNANVGGVSINTSGRSFIWSVVYKSAQRNIIFGMGEDGPPEMFKYPKWQHPHNDYLRLLHHNGIIGLSLWLIFFFILLFYLIKRVRYSSNDEYKSYYLFNLIFLFSILIIMVTDNPVVYSYIMFPLMILSGSSIALYQIEKKDMFTKEIYE